MLVISWTSLGEGESDDADLSFEITEHTLVFDAVLAENHEGSAEITEHSVESGSPIADHKRALPRLVTIEGLVSQTPLDAPPPTGDASRSITASIQANDANANVTSFSSTFDRIQDAFDQLDLLRITDTELTVSTRVKVYDSLQLIRIQTPREPTDGDSVRFILDFKEINVAETRQVDAPQSREPRGRNRRRRGGQETEDGQSTERNQSTLNRLGESVGILPSL